MEQPLQESSDDDVPLIEIQKKIQGQKRKPKRNVQAIDLTSCFSDSDYSDLDKNYLPSSDSSSYSEDYQTPVIDKRKRKWMRKRIRPLKREQSRKEAMKKTRKMTSESATINIAEDQDSELQEALQKSKKDTQLNILLKRFAETRLTNLLSSNGLERKLVKPDGNCFFNSIIHQSGTEMSTTELRSTLCKHLGENKKHYIGYITKTNAKDELQLSEHYSKLVEELGKDGIWNTEMSDVLPLATANMLSKSITIYSSRLHSPIIHVTPDMGIGIQECAQDIKIAYLIVPGLEHYDSCIQTTCNKKKQQSTPPKNVQNDYESCSIKTPTKLSNSKSNKFATPRKKADYVSPKKVKQSRKKTPNVCDWIKNIRKTNRNTGKAYISDKSKKVIEAKKVLPAVCNNCKNKCTEKVSEESRKNIFRSYYDETMTFERKRDFICQHVEVLGTSKRYGRKRKQETRKYYLPVEKQRKQVCKSFFLNTLNIGKKTIECSLKRKCHGSFDGMDQRGRHTPANKTDDHTIKHIKNHIESFPAVESHYTRKSTSRKFLSQDLSIRKMYDLYKTKCQEDGITPVSEKVYRNVFCNEYNFSFHKPKKDTCQTCNTYNEKKKTGNITESDQAMYIEHMKRKEQARTEKDADKKRAKNDKSLFVATFDLQAVLQTPCSNVSQTYYKRKLNSYNLTIYSLADARGTCYIWNETHGQRGSSEVGTCVISHIKSLPSSIRHVVLYSDCCSGQNRNKFLASGLLHTISHSPHIEIIEQKFLESGHTQMECDSMHSAIEHAKRQTTLYVPEQWDTIFQMARRQNPYVVVPMRFDNFYDLKKFANDTFKNFKTTVDGDTVNWLKVKVLKVQKSNPDQILVKYDFDDSNFLCINVKRAQRGRPKSGDKLPMKYQNKLPISVAKKNDLLDLCKGLVIPEIYWQYYDNLLTNKNVKDTLPCTDILDDCVSDTDEEL